MQVILKIPFFIVIPLNIIRRLILQNEEHMYEANFNWGKEISS